MSIYLMIGDLKMKRFKISTLLLFTSLMVVALAACSNTKKEENKGNSKDVVTETPETTTTPSPVEEEKPNVQLPITDRAGNKITIPQTINSIVSLSPATTEILIALGVQDLIVAADTESQSYGFLAESVTFVDMMTADMDKIATLTPDIVFASTTSIAENPDTFKALTDAGICVALIPTSDSIQGIYQDITFIANSLQLTSIGQGIVKEMQTVVNEVKEIAGTITEKKSVYFELSSTPALTTGGVKTFIHDMITIIGAENAFAAETGWVTVTEEAVIAANPSVIITKENSETAVDEIKARANWSDVAAIANDEVYSIDNKTTSLANQYVVDALKEMAELVYPDFYNFE